MIGCQCLVLLMMVENNFGQMDDIIQKEMRYDSICDPNMHATFTFITRIWYHYTIFHKQTQNRNYFCNK